MFFKVNVRFRHPPRFEDVEVVEGIRTYSEPALFDQELAGTASRVEPRDLFDLVFVMQRYGDSLGDDQIRRADVLTVDLDRLERRYKLAFEGDEVLRGLSSVDEVVLRFRTQQLTKWIDGGRKFKSKASRFRTSCSEGSLRSRTENVWRRRTGQNLTIARGPITMGSYPRFEIHRANPHRKGTWILIGRFHVESPTANCTPPNPEDGTLRRLGDRQGWGGSRRRG